MKRPAAKSLPVALISGASSGIGAALARRFAHDGHHVVLVARRAGKLQGLCRTLQSEFGVQALAEPADLTQPNAVAALAARLARRKLQIDVLVNNAGVLEQGLFARLPARRHQQIIDLNVSALTAMLVHFVPPMVARRRGRVLNVASIAAFQSVPTLATYAATKAYVLSLSESLAEELRGTGVTVTALCPGITATEMLSSAKRHRTALAGLPGFLVGDAEDVAAAGYRACMAGDVIAVPGIVNRAAVIASRATPKWLMRRTAGAIGRKVL